MYRLLAFTALLGGALVALAADTPAGFEPLFNGKDLAGWKPTGNPKVWAVENGAIVCKGGGGGYLLTDKEYGRFAALDA